MIESDMDLNQYRTDRLSSLVLHFRPYRDLDDIEFSNYATQIPLFPTLANVLITRNFINPCSEIIKNNLDILPIQSYIHQNVRCTQPRS
jgi:hypothetical protein